MNDAPIKPFDAGGKLLVTDAGGSLGSAIVKLLAIAGVSHAVAGSLRPQTLSLPAGFEARRIDFGDRKSVAAAFTGIERALLVASDAHETQGLRTGQIAGAIAAAQAAGVHHLLYTSTLNPDRSLNPIAPHHFEIETAIRRSGLNHTILRISEFTDSLFSILARALASGTWLTSAGDGRINCVARIDAARAAAEALIHCTADHEILDLTGPQSLTIADIADIAETVTACPVSVEQLSDDALLDAIADAGIAADDRRLLTALYGNMRAGNLDLESSAVCDLTNLPATSVAACLSAQKVMLNA